MTDPDANGPDYPWLAHYPEGVARAPRRDPRALTAQLRDRVAAAPDLGFLDWRGGTISFGAFAADVARAASALTAMGLGEGDVVALHLPNHVHHPVLFYGALFAGCRIAHLSPLDAPAEMRHKLHDSGARLLATLDLPEMAEKAGRMLAEGDVERLLLCDDARWGDAGLPRAETPPGAMPYADFLALATTDRLPEGDPDPSTIALLQYTGGTTGAPKGAELTHANLSAAVDSFEAWYAAYPPPAGEREKVLLVLPLFHIYALAVVLLRQARAGGLICLRMRFDAGDCLRDVERHRITAFAGVPTMWTAVTNHPDFPGTDVSSLRICSSGGAPQPQEVARRFTGIAKVPLLGGWGMTETAAAGTSIPPWGLANKPGTIGLPLPGIEIRVLDPFDSSRILPVNQPGEIAIRGANVSAAYWRRPDATAESRAGEFFLTGDLGRMDEDGYVFLVDRKKDLILSGGFNVYPQAIEQALHEHPAIMEAAVIGVPDSYRGESAKAFAVLRPGAAAPSLEDLHAFLAEYLGRHELPREIEWRETLPRTGVGKLSRKTLRDEERAHRAET